MAKYYESINFNNSAMLAKNGTSVAPASDVNKPAVLSETTSSESVNLKFRITSGDTRSITINNPKSDLTDEEVTAAVKAVLSNAEAFEDAPTAALSATGRVTTSINYDI